MDNPKVLIINGPNLNLLGTRQTDVYGQQSFDDYLPSLQGKYSTCNIDYFQSNHEGEIIDKIQSTPEKYNVVILNAGAYTHTSIAIRDAISSVDIMFIEVHISNIYDREQFRHHSYLSEVCLYTIIGKGLSSYEEGIKHFLEKPATRAISATIKGKVQGVHFRYSTVQEAKKLSIKGFAENKEDGSVYLEAVGSEPNIETFIKYLHTGPEHSKVDEIIFKDIDPFEKDQFVTKWLK